MSDLHPDRRVRASHLGALVHHQGDWIVTHPMLDVEVLVEEPSPPLFDLLATTLDVARKPCSIGELAEKLAAHGVDADEHEAFVTKLVETGLVCPVGGEAPWDRAGLCADGVDGRHDVARYVSARRGIDHVDYASPGALADDDSLMRRYAERAAPPPASRIHDGPRTPLPHPASGVNSRLAALLFWAFGWLRDAQFGAVLPAALKATPSKGARHPFEAYVLAGSDAEVAPGLHHYRGEDHALVQLDAAARPRGRAPIQLLITIVWERVQWRYRHSWAYKDVFYDYGHLRGTLVHVAATLGIGLVAATPPALAVLEPLTHELVAAFDVEGT